MYTYYKSVGNQRVGGFVVFVLIKLTKKLQIRFKKFTFEIKTDVIVKSVKNELLATDSKTSAPVPGAFFLVKFH